MAGCPAVGCAGQQVISRAENLMALVLLIDGHSQAYRAYFGMKTPLSTREGEPTAAVYGFARKLLATLREYQPEYVAVAFDSGETWRHAEFPAD